MSEGAAQEALRSTRKRDSAIALLALGLLASAVLAAYHNSLNGPFILDDKPSIVDNTDLGHLTTTLRENPLVGATLVGRPVLRLSLWVNYALGGKEVRGYHVLNLLLHTLAAFALWGLLRQIFGSPRLEDRYGRPAPWLALAISLIWVVHPLQTESVTYVVQRAEILGGLFYLLTLYCVARAAQAEGWRRRLWYGASIVLCILGLTSKETVATAPLVALAMDRVFFAQSWRRLWNERGGLYAALAGSWVLLAMQVWVSHKRMGSAGFGLGTPWWAYALTQPYYLCRYLGLSVWPHALTFDYGWYLAHSVEEVAPYAAIVLLLLTLTILVLWRNPPLGFCGLWFFLILAPTSSVVPLVTQTGAEHRMYLPLAGLLGLAVVGGYTLWGRVRRERPGLTRALPLVVLGAVLAALGARTVVRNEDYRSEVSIWQSAIDRWPSNPRAHASLGVALANAGHLSEGVAQAEAALRLKPDDPRVNLSLGNDLASMGRLPEAIAQYEEALRRQPGLAAAHLNLGNALAKTGRLPEAIAQYEAALSLEPDLAGGHLDLGNAFAKTGQFPEAIVQYETALRLEPAYAQAHLNLGSTLAKMGRLPEAIAQYEEALRLEPGYAQAHLNLGNALAKTGDLPEAIAHYEAALRLQPDLAGGRLPKVIARLEEALHLPPEQRRRAAGDADPSQR